MPTPRLSTPHPPPPCQVTPPSHAAVSHHHTHQGRQNRLSPPPGYSADKVQGNRVQEQTGIGIITRERTGKNMIIVATK